MDQPSIISTLAELNLPAIRFFHDIDSTNDEAWRWVVEGAPHLALVIADAQSAGRGRSSRRWVTTPGASLAFSLILRAPPIQVDQLNRISGLGAVSVRSVLQEKCNLTAQIKWPNDILIHLKKVAGVLVEAHWSGQDLTAVIVGIGINIAPQSVSELNHPTSGLNFPASCIETEWNHPVNRLELLHDILVEFIYTWFPQLSSEKFLCEWEENLAFRDQWVRVYSGDPNEIPGKSSVGGAKVIAESVGKVVGISQDGELKLITRQGKLVCIGIGELHLALVNKEP